MAQTDINNCIVSYMAQLFELYIDVRYGNCIWS